MALCFAVVLACIAKVYRHDIVKRLGGMLPFFQFWCTCSLADKHQLITFFEVKCQWLVPHKMRSKKAEDMHRLLAVRFSVVCKYCSD